MCNQMLLPAALVAEQYLLTYFVAKLHKLLLCKFLMLEALSVDVNATVDTYYKKKGHMNGTLSSYLTVYTSHSI